MGFFKKLGEGIKETSKKAMDKLQEMQENAAREEEKRRIYSRLKRQLLSKVTLTDMKKICKEYGIEAPSMYEEDAFSGKRYKKKGTERSIYYDHVMYHVYLYQLIEFAKKRRMKIQEIIEEKNKFDKKYDSEVKESKEKKNKLPASEENENEDDEVTQIEITKKKVNTLDLVLEKIEEKFDFDRIRDENELEGLVMQFLNLVFDDKKIERQYKTPNGNIDIVIDDKYGIELKIAENNKIIENLESQVLKYVRHFGKNRIAVIILKTPKTNVEKLEEYVEHYQTAGAKVLILDKGTLRRRKNNVKTFKLVK